MSELVWRRNVRQPNTQQGMGKQHLQSTVNMANEQSGLFPLGIYSRGNEKEKRDDESLRKKKVLEDTPQHDKHKLQVWTLIKYILTDVLKHGLNVSMLRAVMWKRRLWQI